MQTNSSQSREHDIVVDLDANDPDKAVSRVPVRQQRTENQQKETTPEEERRLDRKAFAKRFGRIERNFEQRLADQEARHQREIAALRGNGGKLEARREGGNEDSAHEAEMTQLAAKLEAAQEAGDSKAVSKITLEISRKDAMFWAKKEAQVRGEPAPTDTRQAAPAAPKNKALPDKGNTPVANKWLRLNEEWLQDDEFRIEQQGALIIDGELDDEGFDPGTDEYFDEMNARLLKKFPKLEVIGTRPKKGRTDQDERRVQAADDDDSVDEERPTRRAPPVSSFEDRGAPVRGSRNGRRTMLTAEQRQTMLAVNMDPDNNSHVLTFLREAGQVE